MNDKSEYSRIEARIARIERILRAAKMHEPDCKLDTNVYRDEDGCYVPMPPCSCWLKK